MLKKSREFNKKDYDGLEGFYDSIHDKFDLNHPAVRHIYKVISKNIPRSAIDGKMILDTGCGYQARVIRLLLETYKPSKIKAVDINPINIQHCQEMTFICDTEFKCNDLEKENWEDGFFDLIICEGVLMCTTHPEQNIVKFKSALKPSGYLVLGIYCWRPPYLWFNSLLRMASRIIPFQRLVTSLKKHDLLSYTLINVLDSMFVPVEKYFNINDIKQQLSLLNFNILYCDLAPSYIPFLKKQSKTVTKLCGNHYYHLVMQLP